MENELTHWGVVGMKWGVRRYQNKDGTLTAAGKKRYAKEMEKLKAEEKIAKNKQRTQAKLNKLEEKRREIDAMNRGESVAKTQKQTSSRGVKDMSDEELRATVNRMLLEQQYSKMNPQQVSTGKKFVNKVVNDVLVPAATEVGKNVVKESLNKAVKNAMAKDDKNK